MCFFQIEKPQFPCFGEYPCNKRLRKTTKYWMDGFWTLQVYMDTRFLSTLIVYFKTEKLNIYGITGRILRPHQVFIVNLRVTKITFF